NPPPTDIHPLSLHDALPISWVQLEEPALVSDSTEVPAEQLLAAVIEAYRALATDLTDRPAILVAAPYGDLGAALPVLAATDVERSEEHTSELQSRRDLVCRL